jgi:hypothetical protein
VSVGSILGGAFRLLREKPAAVAIWGIVYAASLVAIAFASRPMNARLLAAGAAPEAQLATMPLSMALLLAYLIVFILLFTAAQRAVLRPEDRGLFHLRLGMDEVRQIALAIFLLILFYVGAILVTVIVGLVVGLAALLASNDPSVVMVAVIVVDGALVLCLASWLAVRLSLAFPLTLVRGRFVIGESWRLTRGHFWPLFGAYFVIYLLIVIVSVAGGVVTAGPYLAELSRHGFSADGFVAAGRAQMARQAGPIDAMMIVGWLFGAVSGGLAIALDGGAIATAARELADDTTGMADTFA